MNEEDLRKAEGMLKNTKKHRFGGDVINQLKIGRTVFFRCFPPDRIGSCAWASRKGGTVALSCGLVN
jgi:hypothetical protein